MDSRLLGRGWGRALAPSPYLTGTPCLADAPRRVDRPPTHFFVKKKFIPRCVAGAATQNISSGLCCAHAFCKRGTLCDVRNPPGRATAWRRHPCHAPDVPSERLTRGPSQLSALADALCVVKRAARPLNFAESVFITYRVGLPPLLYVPKERMGEGTAAAPKERRWWKDSHGSRNPPIRTYRSETLSQSVQES